MSTSTEESARPARRDGRRALVAGAFAAIAMAVVIALVTDAVVLRLIGAVLVVLVPGASVVTILRLTPRDRAEAILLALGMGLVVLIVGGLLLDVVTSLTPAGWAGFVVLLVGLALLSARTRAPSDRVPDGAPALAGRADGGARPVVAPTSKVVVAATALVCVVAVGAALAIAVHSAREQSGESFTTLAFRSGGGSLTEPREGGVAIVVENHERVAASYDLTVTAGDVTVLDVDAVRLDADEGATFDVPLGEVAPGTRVEAVLFRDGGTDPYRRITLTVP